MRIYSKKKTMKIFFGITEMQMTLTLCLLHRRLKLYEAKWSKYPNYKSELVSHLNFDDSEIFDTQTWTPKQRLVKIKIDV